MRNWESLKSKYLGLNREQQLGNLAASLHRVGTHVQFGDEDGSQVAMAAIAECQHFSEWIVLRLNLEDESELALATELLEMGRQVSGWKYQWQASWLNSERRNSIIATTEVWSDRLLAVSGILPRDEQRGVQSA